MTEPRRGTLAAFFLAALALGGCAAQRSQAGRALHFVRYKLERPSARLDCGVQADMSFCRYRPKGLEEDSATTLYFFHYASGDAKSFSRLGLANAFYHWYKERRLKPPRIITISFGSHWLLSDRPGRKQIVSTRRLIEQSLPFLERRFGAAAQRLLWGMSQGGYNALQVALAAPGDWKAVAVSCPALHARDPFEDSSSALAKSTGAPLSSVRDGLALFNVRLADAAAWRAEEPIARIKSGAALAPLLIQTNKNDEFGFQEGALALAQALAGRRPAATVDEGKGGHCVFDAARVAEFFAGRTVE